MKKLRLDKIKRRIACIYELSFNYSRNEVNDLEFQIS